MHTKGPLTVGKPDWIDTKEWGRWTHYPLTVKSDCLLPDATDTSDVLHYCIARVSRKDDAEYIARAVNAHADLLAACQFVEQTLAVGFWCEHENTEPQPGCKHCIGRVVRAAIDKAIGK